MSIDISSSLEADKGDFGGGNFPVLPAGNYTAWIKDASFGQSKAGKDMITVTLNVITEGKDGNDRNNLLWDYVLTDISATDHAYKTAKLVRYAKIAYGDQVKEKAQELDPDDLAWELAGNEVRIKVKHEIYQGEKRHKLDGLPEPTGNINAEVKQEAVYNETVQNDGLKDVDKKGSEEPF